MDISNRGANTWDALLSRLRGEPAAESRVVDELILGSVFLATAPVVVFYLSRASGRSFLAMARSMVNYARHYEGEKAAMSGRAKMNR